MNSKVRFAGGRNIAMKVPPQVTEAFLKMKKFDIGALKRAYKGE